MNKILFAILTVVGIAASADLVGEQNIGVVNIKYINARGMTYMVIIQDFRALAVNNLTLDSLQCAVAKKVLIGK